MLDQLEEILTRYENGQVSRRDVLAALFAMTLPATLPADTAPRIGTATRLNHATLYVRNVARSQAFYQDLFGMPILTPNHCMQLTRAPGHQALANIL